MATHPYPYPYTNHHDYFDARDPWTAAYLLAMDVPLLGTHLTYEGKARWTFDNTSDTAWTLSLEWRNEENATVNGPALMRAYREVSRRAAEARDADRKGAKTSDRPAA